MKIGEKIAEARKKKNLTQEQLAELMAVTRQTVSRWESNLAYPEMEKVVKLASLLKVSCDYLLNDDYESPTDGAESAGGPRNPVTRLLLAAKGRLVRMQLTDEADYDLYNKLCTIVEFDGMWMKVEYKKGKATESRLDVYKRQFIQSSACWTAPLALPTW